MNGPTCRISRVPLNFFYRIALSIGNMNNFAKKLNVNSYMPNSSPDKKISLKSLHLNLFQLLFDFEASAESKNDNDHTTLHVAAFHGHNNVITELLEQDKSIINNQDEDGNTALHLASSQGKIKCVDM